MIVFLVNTGFEYTHAPVVEAARDFEVRALAYDEVLKSRSLPKATYVFTDLDRMTHGRLGTISQLYRMMQDKGWRTLNDPRRIRSRCGLLKLLRAKGFNSFNAYRAEERARPRRWPVFLRTEGDHRPPDGQLLSTPAELSAAIERAVEAGKPLSSLLIIEYAAEPVRPGLYRKLSTFRIGERSVAHPCVHDTQWVAKHGQPGIAPPELYVEELEIVRRDPFADRLRPAFELARIEYGRSDFGLVGGQVQLYEINLNPTIKFPADALEARVETWEVFRRNYLDALRAIDSEP